MASNDSQAVELKQESIEYVLLEERDPGKSPQPLTKDVQLISGLHVITPGSVTSEANLTAVYQYPSLSGSLSGHQDQTGTLLSQEQHIFVKTSTMDAVSLCSSSLQQESQMVKAYTTLAEIGDLQSELQGLQSEAMSYVVEVPSHSALATTQLDSSPIVQIESLSSEVLNSLPPGSHIILDSNVKKYPQLLAALANKQSLAKNPNGSSENNLTDSELVKQVFLNKSDIMLNGEMATFSSSEKDTRGINADTELDMTTPQAGNIQDNITSQESARSEHEDPDNLDRSEVREKNSSNDQHIKMIQNMDWPQNNTCKVFNNVVAILSKEFLSQVRSEIFSNTSVDKSMLLAQILLGRRPDTDMMIREFEDEFFLAGDLIDVMEMHNVLLSNLQEGVKCKHKPMSACLPMTKDQAVMCDGIPQPTNSVRKKHIYYEYLEDNSEGDDGSVSSSEKSQRRYGKRPRRLPIRLQDNNQPPQRCHRRRHRRTTNKVTHVVITPIDQAQGDKADSEEQVKMENSDGSKQNNTGTMEGNLEAQSLNTTSVVSDIDLMQTVIKPNSMDTQDGSLLTEKQMQEEVESLLPIIAAAEDSERHDQSNPSDLNPESKEQIKEKGSDLKPDRKKIINQKKKMYEELSPFRYFCNECSFKTKRKSHFRKHQLLHTEKKLPVLHCLKCDYSTLHLAHLRHHEVTHNSNALQCCFCSYRTTSFGQLKKHTRIRHQLSGQQSKELIQHKCTHCSYTTDKQHLFQRHMLRHMHVDGNRTGMHGMLVKSYQCTHCTYSTDIKDKFVRHMVNVHSNNRPHLCHLCGMGFKRTDTLKTHQLVHLDKNQRNYKFFCPECNKGVRSKAHLEEHMSMHTKKREYLCEICGSAFKTRSIQRRHVATIHKNPNGHVCKLCNKGFSTKFTLQRHQRIHEMAEIQTQQKQDVEQITSLSYPGELSSLKVSPDGETVDISMNDQPGLIHIQPILQDQGLTQQQVITELQVLPIGSTLEQMAESGDGSQVTVLEEGFTSEQQGLEVQLQPALVQNDSGGTTLLYLTAVPSDVT